jgi:hypothetical protein
MPDAAREIVSSEAPGLVTLRRIDWELTPFCCTDCGHLTGSPALR